MPLLCLEWHHRCSNTKALSLISQGYHDTLHAESFHPKPHERQLLVNSKAARQQSVECDHQRKGEKKRRSYVIVLQGRIRNKAPEDFQKSPTTTTVPSHAPIILIIDDRHHCGYAYAMPRYAKLRRCWRTSTSQDTASFRLSAFRPFSLSRPSPTPSPTLPSSYTTNTATLLLLPPYHYAPVHHSYTPHCYCNHHFHSLGLSLSILDVCTA